MKYKMLINGRKTALLKEFWVHAETNFECMSTSENMEDIAMHFRYYEPDGYICCPDIYSPDVVSHLNTMRRTHPYSKAAIFVVAEPEVCAMLEERAPNLADLYLSRPITINKLTILIKKFYEDQEEQKRYEEEQAIARKKAEEERLAAEAAEAAASGKKHILIIDDDRNVLKMLKAALEEKYEVTTMVSGRMALRFLETRDTDLILLDYKMPIESGPEVYVQIRAYERFADVPVVFLTGVADSEKIRQVLELRPQGYLLKPIEMDRLMATIESLIG